MDDIKKVAKDIVAVEKKIQDVEEELKKASSPEDNSYFRKKEEQLRQEKLQLGEKELLLLKAGKPENVGEEPSAIILKSLLSVLPKLEEIDDRAFNRLLRQKPVSYTRGPYLLDLYRDAQKEPGKSTMAAFTSGENVYVNGAVDNSGYIFRGTRDDLPVVFKFAPKGKTTPETEFNNWKQLCQHKHFLPLDLVTVKGKKAIVMPPCVQTAYSLGQPSSPNQMPASLLNNLKRQIMSALEHLHQKGWSFCDVKPQNIFFHTNGSFLLGDYGGLTKHGEMAAETSFSWIPCDWPLDCVSASGKAFPKSTPQLDLVMLECSVRFLDGEVPAKNKYPTSEVKSDSEPNYS